jgi:hypothetical protein
VERVPRLPDVILFFFGWKTSGKKPTATAGVIDELPMPSAAPLAADKSSNLGEQEKSCAASEATTRGSTEDKEMLNDSPKTAEVEEEAMDEAQTSSLGKLKLSNCLNKRSAPLQIPLFVLSKLTPQKTATGLTASGTSSVNKEATTANLKALPTIPKRPPPPGGSPYGKDTAPSGSNPTRSTNGCS